MVEGGSNNEGGIEMLDLDREAQARAAKPDPPLAQRLLGRKTAEWLHRRCGCFCGCLGLNDEEYHGLVAGDGLQMETSPSASIDGHHGGHGSGLSSTRPARTSSRGRRKEDDDDDDVGCNEIARLLSATDAAATKWRDVRGRRQTRRGGIASDYIGVLTAISLRLHGSHKEKNFAKRARQAVTMQAVQLFGGADVGLHLHLVFERAPQIIQFFLPQLLMMSMMHTPDREALELFVLQVCRKRVYFALLCWWFLEAQATDEEPGDAGKAAMMRKRRKRLDASRSGGFMSFLTGGATPRAAELEPDEELRKDLRRRVMDILSGERFARRKEACHITETLDTSSGEVKHGDGQQSVGVHHHQGPPASSNGATKAGRRPGDDLWGSKGMVKGGGEDLWGSKSSQSALLGDAKRTPTLGFVEARGEVVRLASGSSSQANRVPSGEGDANTTHAARASEHSEAMSPPSKAISNPIDPFSPPFPSSAAPTSTKTTPHHKNIMFTEESSSEDEGSRRAGREAMPRRFRKRQTPPKVLPEALILSDDNRSDDPSSPPDRGPMSPPGTAGGGSRKRIEAKARELGHRFEKAGEAGMKGLTQVQDQMRRMSHVAIDLAKASLRASRPEMDVKEALWREEEAFLDLPARYYDFIRRESSFVGDLIAISRELCDVSIPSRLPTLKVALANMNQKLPATVYVPLCNATDELNCVLRIATEESFVFSTRERAPFMMLLEVIGTGHRWSSSKLGNGPDVKLPAVPWRDAGGGYESGRGACGEMKEEEEEEEEDACGRGGKRGGPGEGGEMSDARTGSDGGRGAGETDAGEETDGRVALFSDTDGGWTPVGKGAGKGEGGRHGLYFDGDAEGGEGGIDGAEVDEADADREGGGKEKGVVDPRLSRLRVADCKQLVADRDSVGSAVGEQWRDKQKRVREASPYGKLPHWRLVSMIVKSKDDVRQEQFATQLITLFAQIFRKAKLPLWLRPYQVLATSYDSGLIEMVPDTTSLHGLKKQMMSTVQMQKAKGGTPKTATPTLVDWFEERFGGAGGESGRKEMQTAKRRYAQSLAAYAVVCYIMQIKDRHNGNILVEQTGRIVHIDFGFMLSNSPGMINFEKAAFKLSREMVDVLGGQQSELYKDFERWAIDGYMEARAHRRQIMMMVEIAMAGQPDLPCFSGRNILEELEDRFKPEMSKSQAAVHFKGLIAEAFDNWFTRQYDKFQRLSNGILE